MNHYVVRFKFPEISYYEDEVIEFSIPRVISKTGIRKLFRERGYDTIKIKDYEIHKNRQGMAAYTCASVYFRDEYSYQEFTESMMDWLDNIKY